MRQSKIGRNFIQEIENAPWLNKASNDACNSDTDEVSMEKDVNDGMNPFAIHLKQDINVGTSTTDLFLC